MTHVARELELPPALKRRLLHLRVMSGIEAPPTIDVDHVNELESELGLQLGDCFLALLANRDGLLDEYDVRLRNVGTMTRDFHAQGMPRGMLGIGRDPESGFLVGAPPLGRLVHILDPESGAARQLTVEQWLDELLAAFRDTVRDDDGEAKARAHQPLNEDEVAKFKPALVHDVAPPKRLVTHPKFGFGEVLNQDGDKLEIRFTDGSVKNLLARFVTPVEEPKPGGNAG